MRKIKVVALSGAFVNHQHFCLLYALVDRKSFIRLCPHKIGRQKDVMHNDACDKCRYASRMDFYPDFIKLEIDGHVRCSQRT
jgi:hypothetical protein